MTTGTYEIGQKLAGYRLELFLGKGGFGEVWKAKSDGGVPVAVKFIHRRDNKLGDKERSALEHIKELKSDHLVTIRAIHCLDEHELVLDVEGKTSSELDAQVATYVVAMDLGNRSLRNRLEDSPTGLPLPELMEHMDSVAKAIDFLNLPKGSRRPIVHRDIKPENVLIFDGDGEYGKAKVCDYGIAYPIDAERTQTETVAGDFRYIAPEQTRGKKDPKADQYSLAISYYELRFGVLPVDAETSNNGMALFMAHAEGKMDFAKAHGHELAVLKKATSIEPNDRFDSCVEFVEALRGALAPPPPSDLLAKRVQPNVIRLDWEADGEVTFEVWRSLDTNEVGEKIADGWTSTHYMDEDTDPSQRYAYRVRTVNEITSSSFRTAHVEPRGRTLAITAASLFALVTVAGLAFAIARLNGPAPSPSPDPNTIDSTTGGEQVKQSTPVRLRSNITGIKQSPQMNWRFELTSVEDSHLETLHVVSADQRFQIPIPVDERYRINFEELTPSFDESCLFIPLIDNPNDDVVRADCLYKLKLNPPPGSVSPIGSGHSPTDSESTAESSLAKVAFGPSDSSHRELLEFAIDQAGEEVICVYDYTSNSIDRSLSAEVWSSGTGQKTPVDLPSNWNTIKFAGFVGDSNNIILGERREIAAFHRRSTFELIADPIRPVEEPRWWCKTPKLLPYCYFISDDVQEKIWKVGIAEEKDLLITELDKLDFRCSDRPQLDNDGTWMLSESSERVETFLVNLSEPRGWKVPNTQNAQLRPDGKFASWIRNGRFEFVDLDKLGESNSTVVEADVVTTHILLAYDMNDELWKLSEVTSGSSIMEEREYHRVLFDLRVEFESDGQETTANMKGD